MAKEVKGSPTKALGEDHVAVLASLGQLESAVSTVSRAGDVEGAWADITQVSDFLAADLELHLVQEEEALFPAMESVMGADGGPTGVMRAEHVDMRQASSELAHLVEQVKADGPNAVAMADLLDVTENVSDVLKTHIYKEDNILFPMAERILQPFAQEQVAAKMVALVKSAAAAR